jgi:hypothetical protein
MQKLTLAHGAGLALVLLAGCAASAEIPPEERSAPRRDFTLDTARVRGEAVKRAHEVPETVDQDDVAELVRTLYGCEVRLDGRAIEVACWPSAHEQIDGFMKLIAHSHERVAASVRVYDVPEECASTLGPLELARGAGHVTPLYVVAVKRAALDRIERLVAEGRADSVWEAQASGGVARWLTCREEQQTTLPSGFSYRGPSFLAENALSTVERCERVGVSARLATVPMADGRMLVAFRSFERVALSPHTITSRSCGDRLAAPVSLAASVEERAEDAVLLGPDEAVGLVGVSPRQGYARLLVLVVAASG